MGLGGFKHVINCEKNVGCRRVVYLCMVLIFMHYIVKNNYSKCNVSRVGMVVLAASMLSTTSCNKPSLPAPEEENRQVELVDGLKMTGTRLSFEGPKEFEEAMERLRANPDEFAKKISRAGFRNADHHVDYVTKKTSRVYKLASAGALQDDNYEEEEIAGEEKPISVDELVEDPLLRGVLNDELEIEMAGTVYRVTPYGTLMANVAN